MPHFIRARKMVIDALSGPRIVFHHVAKCGGTSVAQALHLRYAVSFAGFPTLPIYRTVGTTHPNANETDRAHLVDDFQEQLFLYYLFRDIRCISGHVRFSNLAYDRFSSQYNFITTMRDPVSLVISHYFFQSQRPADVWTNTMDIHAYLETPEVQELGAIYSYFFSGLPTDSDPRGPAAIERAKANLRLFAAVGFVDDMPRFRRQLHDQLGIRLYIGHANRSQASKSDRVNIITPDVRRRIEALSSTNIEIYEFAKRELVR